VFAGSSTEPGELLPSSQGQNDVPARLFPKGGTARKLSATRQIFIGGSRQIAVTGDEKCHLK
jgi:hypothetical protein